MGKGGEEFELESGRGVSGICWDGGKMIDQEKLRQDALYAGDKYDADPVVSKLAATVLFILDHPTCLVPESHAVVPKPELLGLGVNDRRAGA